MKKCPICFQPLINILFNQYCYYHGNYQLINRKLSDNFYNFQFNMNNISYLSSTTRFLGEQKEETIKKLISDGVLDAVNVFKMKADNIIEIVKKAKIAMMKIFVDKYIKDSGYKNPNSFYDKYKLIIKDWDIKLSNNNKYSPFEILKDLRDNLIHPNKEANPKYMSKSDLIHLEKNLSNVYVLRYYKDNSNVVIKMIEYRKNKIEEPLLKGQTPYNRYITSFIGSLNEMLIYSIRNIELQ